MKKQKTSPGNHGIRMNEVIMEKSECTNQIESMNDEVVDEFANFSLACSEILLLPDTFC